MDYQEYPGTSVACDRVLARRRYAAILDYFHFGTPALLLARFTRQHKRLGDFLARSTVMQVK